ncbi:MAG: F0F1 ATP synthase subunit B [Bacteroidales bacterium]|nr:F0F1 ATP synthase subunit B [Bacteroidales bacterium]
MELITPSIGLLFWMLVGFSILFFILAKFAWPIVMKAINSREERIESQLAEAERVRQDMKNLKSEHQALLEQAKEERDQILADARKIREKLYEETKETANKEAATIIEDAKKAIHFEKLKAMTDMKNEIANMSIEIAEKVLGNELSAKEKQEELVNNLMKDINLN